jgi:hypothetical protein
MAEPSVRTGECEDVSLQHCIVHPITKAFEICFPVDLAHFAQHGFMGLYLGAE